MPIAWAGTDRQTGGQIAVSLNAPLRQGHNKFVWILVPRTSTRRRPHKAIDRYLPNADHVHAVANIYTLLLLSINGADKQTDTVHLHRLSVSGCAFDCLQAMKE